MEKCPVIIKHDGGAPLFSENIPCDFRTVYSLRKYNMLYRSKAAIPSLVLLPAAAVILAVLGYYLLAIILGIVTACIFYLTVFSLKSSSQRIYERAYKDETLRLFSFYDDHFTAETEKSALVLDYDRIERIISHDTYLMIFLNNGLEFAIPETAECYGQAVSLLNEKTKGQIHK
ncbi:MAG: YcxB family protein [Oscillospiraceae bacterium]|nr:YcxB family protein [Oscillospiraceae bacterium]